MQRSTVLAPWISNVRR